MSSTSNTYAIEVILKHTRTISSTNHHDTMTPVDPYYMYIPIKIINVRMDTGLYSQIGLILINYCSKYRGICTFDEQLFVVVPNRVPRRLRRIAPAEMQPSGQRPAVVIATAAKLVVVLQTLD